MKCPEMVDRVPRRQPGSIRMQLFQQPHSTKLGHSDAKMGGEGFSSIQFAYILRLNVATAI